MKPVIIIAIAFVLLIPVNAFSISVSEIENKLLQAQSKDDVESVLVEIYTSYEYQQACRELFEKIKSYQGVFDDPTISEKKKADVINVLRDYETLQCRWTQNIWGDAPEQYSKTRCEELIVEFEKYNDQHYDLDKEFRKIKSVDGKDAGETWLSTSEFWYSRDMAREIAKEYRHKCLPNTEQCDELSIEKGNLSNRWSELEEHSLESQYVRIDMQRIQDRTEVTCGYQSSLMSYYDAQEKYFAKPVVLEPEILEEIEIVCGTGTVLIDHICQVDKMEEKEKEIPIEKTIEKTVDIPEEKPSKKSVNWFSSLFDWFGSLFQ